MTPQQEEALEAAKLAAMVSGQLKTIDRSFSDRVNVPANKIDVNAFAAKVKNPNLTLKPASYLTDTPQGFASPLPEEYIQSQVPDTSIGSKINRYEQADEPIALPSIPVDPVSLFESLSVPNKIDKNTPKTNTENVSILTRSDVDSIRNSLKNIDKTLVGMLNFLKDSKTTK